MKIFKNLYFWAGIVAATGIVIYLSYYRLLSSFVCVDGKPCNDFDLALDGRVPRIVFILCFLGALFLLLIIRAILQSAGKWKDERI